MDPTEDPNLDDAESTDPAAEDPVAPPADDTTPADETETQAPEEHEYDAAECAKIEEFAKLLEVPTPYQDIYKRFQEDRDYLANQCLPSQDDEDTVSTNFILRNQYTLIAQIFARNPQPEIRPEAMIGPPPPGLMEFGRTAELVVKRLATEAEIKAKLNGALQDVQTHDIAWLKITTQQDIYKDPLGCTRQNDQLDNIARLRTLIDAYGNTEFDETTAEYKTLTDLSDTVRTYLMGQMQDQMQQQQASQPVDPMTGVPAPSPMQGQIDAMQSGTGEPLPQHTLPEVPVFIGINVDPVLPDDIRVDWDIIRPEDFYQAKWVAHRLYMTADEIADRWHVPSDDIAAARSENKKRASSGGSNKTTEELPTDRTDIEKDNLNGKIAVWEIWDKVAGRRYVYVSGMEYFVVNEVPDVVWHKWFPFFPLVFNRVTGQFYGPSDVRLQMPLQDEINLKRTHEREGQKASYPRWLAKRGTIKEGETAAIENALPYKVVFVESPEDIQKNLIELPNSFKFDPKLYDIEKAKRELEIMAGMPNLASGETSDTNTATEAAIANQHLGIQSSRRQAIVEDYLQDIYTCIAEMALQLFPEANIKQLVGEGAVWPPLNREQMWRMLSLDIKAGSSGQPDEQKELSDLMSMVELGTRLGLVMNGVEVFKRAMEIKDIPGAVERYVIGLMPPAAGGPGAPPPGASNGGPNAQSPGPGDNTGGPRPGSPPIGQGAAAAPTPQSIPNGPA